MLVPKIIIPAEVKFDRELPNQILRQLIMGYIFYLSSIDATNLQICRDL